MQIWSLLLWALKLSIGSHRSQLEMSKLPSSSSIVIINIMITNSTNRILSTCQVLVLRFSSTVSLISSLQIRLKRGWETAQVSTALLCLCFRPSPLLPWCWPCCCIPASQSCSVLTCPLWCPSLNSTIPSPLPPFPGWLFWPSWFSSDAAINDMSSPGRPQPPTAAKPAWKSLCRNQINPEPAQTNRFDSPVCLQDVQGTKAC